MSRSPSRTLKLTYLGDASQLSKTTRGAANDMTSLGDRVKKVGKTLAVGFAAVGAAGLAMGRKLFQAFEQVSTANARVEQVVDSMGNFEGQLEETTKRIVEQAEATARLTGVDRNLIKESQALLLTFDSVNKTAGESGGVFDRATEAAVDLAAAGFGSATSNAQSLGRALEDPIRGLTSLTRQGVTFTEEQQNLIRSLVDSNRNLEAQDVILQAIERQVGGVAEATSNGSDRMRQAFGILTEQVAQALAPAFESLVEFGLKFIDRVANWWDRNGDAIIESFGSFAERVNESWEALKEFGRTVRDDLGGQQTFELLRNETLAVAEAFRETREAFQSMRAVWSSNETTISARIIQTHFRNIRLAAFALSQVLQGLARLLTEVFERAERLGRFFRGESIFPQGGDFIVPDDFEPGVIRPQARNANTVMNINVQGAIDPEGTARTIQRVLGDARLRGTVTPTAVFV